MYTQHKELMSVVTFMLTCSDVRFSRTAQTFTVRVFDTAGEALLRLAADLFMSKFITDNVIDGFELK